jgi:hypothetical protein
MVEDSVKKRWATLSEEADGWFQMTKTLGLLENSNKKKSAHELFSTSLFSLSISKVFKIFSM